MSQSQANQRAGRAGRERAGICYRLYPEPIFQQMPAHTTPEIQRIDLSQVLLQLLAQGVGDVLTFPWLSPPNVQALKQAVELLLLLKATDRDTKTLTAHGRMMSQLPLHPSLSHLLLCSPAQQCSQEMLTAVALLSAENVFLQPFQEAAKQRAVQLHRVFTSQDGDLCTLINIYNAWIQAKKNAHWTKRHFLSMRALRLAESIRAQLTHLMQALQIAGVESTCWPEREPFLRGLTQGLFLNIAQRVHTNHQVEQTGKQQLLSVGIKQSPAPYQTIRGHQPVYIHPSSVLFALSAKRLPAFVIYAEMLTTTKQYMRNVNVIEMSWLTESMPDLFKQEADPATVAGKRHPQHDRSSNGRTQDGLKVGAVQSVQSIARKQSQS